MKRWWTSLRDLDPTLFCGAAADSIAIHWLADRELEVLDMADLPIDVRVRLNAKACIAQSLAGGGPAPLVSALGAVQHIPFERLRFSTTPLALSEETSRPAQPVASLEVEEKLQRAFSLANDDKFNLAGPSFAHAAKLAGRAGDLGRCGEIFHVLAVMRLKQGKVASALQMSQLAAACFLHEGLWFHLDKPYDFLCDHHFTHDSRQHFGVQSVRLRRACDAPNSEDLQPWSTSASMTRRSHLAILSAAPDLGPTLVGQVAETISRAIRRERHEVGTWLVNGARLYRALVARGRPLHLSTAVRAVGEEAIYAKTQDWLHAVEQPGSEESLMLRAVHVYCKSAAPALRLFDQAPTRPDTFQTLVQCVEDPRNHNSCFQSIIRRVENFGFLLEMAYSQAIAQMHMDLRTLAWIEEMKNDPNSNNASFVINSAEAHHKMHPSAHPWPLDGRSRCGLEIRHFAYCCDPETPIDLAALRHDFKGGYVLERNCCDETYHGFICNGCHDLYSWEVGVVDTLAGQPIKGEN